MLLLELGSEMVYLPKNEVLNASLCGGFRQPFMIELYNPKKMLLGRERQALHFFLKEN